MFGFNEEQNVFLDSNLAVDILGVGGAGTVAAGQTIASHYIFFDPSANRTIEGTITFDSDVVAIITSRDNLIASDGLVNLTANYLSPSLRGLEGGDIATISGTRTVFVDFFATSPGDYIRVLTQFSPAAALEPGTVVIIALGLAGIGFARRKRAHCLHPGTV